MDTRRVRRHKLARASCPLTVRKSFRSDRWGEVCQHLCKSVIFGLEVEDEGHEKQMRLNVFTHTASRNYSFMCSRLTARGWKVARRETGNRHLFPRQPSHRPRHTHSKKKTSCSAEAVRDGRGGRSLGFKASDGARGVILASLFVSLV